MMWKRVARKTKEKNYHRIERAPSKTIHETLEGESEESHRHVSLEEEAAVGTVKPGAARALTNRPV